MTGEPLTEKITRSRTEAAFAAKCPTCGVVSEAVEMVVRSTEYWYAGAMTDRGPDVIERRTLQPCGHDVSEVGWRADAVTGEPRFYATAIDGLGA